MKKIGIMGGTFNPIHFGHLMIAEEVRREFHLEKIIFIPAANPPHKNNVMISAQHRYAMTLLATASNPHFEVSDIEIKRGAHKPSYTYDTVLELKSLYGNDIDIFFIVGADCIHTLPTWHNFQELKELITFVTTKRPNYDFQSENLPELQGAHFKKLNTPELEISSTDLRDRIKLHRNVHYLMPDNVIEYIKKEHLYT